MDVQRNVSPVDTEYVVRGSHDGFVESLDTNKKLIQAKMRNSFLVMEDVHHDDLKKTTTTMVYLSNQIDRETVRLVRHRLQNLHSLFVFSAGQLAEELEDQNKALFPQLLLTERPDRVLAALAEGKIIVLTEGDPTAIIGPVSLFSFLDSPDDYSGRIMIGTFYRLLRLGSFFTALFLPALYIAIISFHFEIFPLSLSQQVKNSVSNIPFRPISEAILLELMIELIRESSIRLPRPIGQTIGIVGGLVIGDAIVSAGLASNLMIIVIASTTLATFVLPSTEMNTALRVIRFPLMIAASLLGFFGLIIGSLLIFIHMMRSSSYGSPFFTPLLPFEPSKLGQVFFRLPHSQPHKLQKDQYLHEQN
ncbi:spore germination protein [Chryseomicrobium sp. FSL W7-1435]|uniref:spore germination protein n=1 Tax=Chryseomicrobium sp. FSL W7-1435 TaxID=2921704 RepID=UPI00315ABD7C